MFLQIENKSDELISLHRLQAIRLETAIVFVSAKGIPSRNFPQLIAMIARLKFVRATDPHWSSSADESKRRERNAMPMRMRYSSVTSFAESTIPLGLSRAEVASNNRSISSLNLRPNQKCVHATQRTQIGIVMSADTMGSEVGSVTPSSRTRPDGKFHFSPLVSFALSSRARRRIRIELKTNLESNGLPLRFFPFLNCI